MLITRHVALASAEESKSAMERWFALLGKVPLRFRCGGRIATLRLSLWDFAKRIGNPHEAAPEAEWRDYEKPLIDGAGKVSAQWYFETPRGPVTVSDYWWNRKDELSVRCADKRAMHWFRRWCKAMGLPYEFGCGR